MPALHLDFLNPRRAPARLGPLLLLAGVLAASAVGWQHHEVGTQADELKQRLADTRRVARRDLPAVEDAAGDPKAIAQEVIRANAVLANLAVPWDAMFAELETAADPNVALLSIQPESGGRRVRLAGEARRFEDLLTYIARLDATAGFAGVFLAGHEMRTGAADRGVAFTISADWVGRE